MTIIIRFKDGFELPIECESFEKTVNSITEKIMDIYEALKAGKTPEEMKHDFEKQLTEAVERKRKEDTAAAKAKVDEVRLVQLREKLIDALDEYCQKAYGADPMNKETRKFVEEMYKTFEGKKFKITPKRKTMTDEDILHGWFQSLI